MLVAIDKKSLDKINSKDEFVYVFENEKLKDLLKLGIRCVNKDYIKYVDRNYSKYDINVISKRDYKFGIIVPNYNYEHTIEKCLKSILNQTYSNFEIIFVDDMSTDKSIEIVKSLKDERIKIIELKQKRLNGGARNEAYLHLSEDVDYVMYVDSDDWLQNKDVLKSINEKLKEKTPDVLFVGMNKYISGEETLAFIPTYKDKYEAFSGWSGSCGKVIRKGLATRQECLYNEGTLKEDKNQHCKICMNMKSFDLLQEPVYVWNQDNHKSVTTIREQIVWGTSTIRHYADTKQLYLTYKGKDDKFDKLMEKRLEKCKEELLNAGDKQY